MNFGTRWFAAALRAYAATSLFDDLSIGREPAWSFPTVWPVRSRGCPMAVTSKSAANMKISTILASVFTTTW